MTEFLVRRIDRHEQVDDPKVRGAYGTLAGAVGILCNVVLCGAKLIIGALSGSVSITADAVNNLADASSSVMTLVGFRLAQKPEDAEHPYGHARIEYLSGLGVAALILVIGVQLAMGSIEKIIHPVAVEFSVPLAVVLILSIGVKVWMGLFQRNLGRRIRSASLQAAAADSRNDAISTGAVLGAAAISGVSGWNLDGYIGLLVAIFILVSSVGIAKETISPLLGASADPELVEKVKQGVLQFDSRILGVHDLMVHDYGPGQTFASIHVEVDRNADVMEMHNMIDNVERMFLETHRIHLTIHYDPIVTDDEELRRMREKVETILGGIDGRLSVHDFRMVDGPEHTNLIFDVAIPYGIRQKEPEILAQLETALQEPGKQYYTVVTFDAAP